MHNGCCSLCNRLEHAQPDDALQRAPARQDRLAHEGQAAGGSAIIPTVRTHLRPSSVAAASRSNTSDDGSTCALSLFPPSGRVRHSTPTQLIVQVLSGQTVPTMLLTHAPCDVAAAHTHVSLL